MGMPNAFSDGADFSGIAPGLTITKVTHKAFARVDEKGTEAAAATGVVFGVTSVPPSPEPFTVDRPLVCLIRDHDTGPLLFLGRVLDPR